MAGERILRTRRTQADGATGVVRLSEAAGTAAQGTTRLSPRVLCLRFTADANGTVLLRTSPAGGAADTDLAGPYQVLAAGASTYETGFPAGTADADNGNTGRDLHYAVTGVGNWTLEVDTVLR